MGVISHVYQGITQTFIRNFCLSRSTRKYRRLVRSGNFHINKRINILKRIPSVSFRRPSYRRLFGCHSWEVSYWGPCSHPRHPLGEPSEPHIRVRYFARLCSNSLQKKVRHKIIKNQSLQVPHISRCLPVFRSPCQLLLIQLSKLNQLQVRYPSGVSFCSFELCQSTAKGNVFGLITIDMRQAYYLSFSSSSKFEVLGDAHTLKPRRWPIMVESTKSILNHNLIHLSDNESI